MKHKCVGCGGLVRNMTNPMHSDLNVVDITYLHNSGFVFDNNALKLSALGAFSNLA